MISENIMENPGCKAPLMMAANDPTKKYGHSDLFRFIIFKNETEGKFSSLNVSIFKRCGQ